MSHSNIQGGSNSIFEVFSPSKPSNSRKIYRDSFLPDLSPSEQRMIVQKPSLHRNFQKAEMDMQAFKTIIEKTLKEAKSKRKVIKNSSKNYFLENSKEIIKLSNNKTNNDQRSKYSAINKFITIKSPKRFREIRPKSPISYEQSMVISKYNSKNKILNSYYPYVPTKKNSYNSDEDKMDSNLDMYYL